MMRMCCVVMRTSFVGVGELCCCELLVSMDFGWSLTGGVSVVVVDPVVPGSSSSLRSKLVRGDWLVPGGDASETEPGGLQCEVVLQVIGPLNFGEAASLL